MTAWTRITHTEVGASGAANIQFTSIPATYTDLVILVSARADRNTYFDNINVIPNGATTGRTTRILFGDGSGRQSFTEAYISAYGSSTTATASTFGNSLIYIPSYRSNLAKSFSMDSVSENNATSAVQSISAGAWTGTDPITSITLDQGDGSNWVQGTMATLYGITAGSSGGVTVSQNDRIETNTSKENNVRQTH